MATTLPINPEARFDITIAGETNLDLILYGLPADMPLERELLASGFEATLGGSSSILAHNLARLGSKVGFITQLGRDELGSIALQRLREASVDLSRITYRDDQKTGVTLLLPHGDLRHILTYPGVIDQMDRADLDVGYLSSSRHFHISSLFLQTGLQPGLPELFSTLKDSSAGAATVRGGDECFSFASSRLRMTSELRIYGDFLGGADYRAVAAHDAGREGGQVEDAEDGFEEGYGACLARDGGDAGAPSSVICDAR